MRRDRIAVRQFAADDKESLLGWIAKHDCVIIVTDHSAYDVRKIAAAAKLVIDTRNSTKDLHEYKDRIIKLGAGNNYGAKPPRDYLDVRAVLHSLECAER
jgi:hypothetical protein